MPRLHEVKSARKAIPSIGVEVGDSYFWWKNRAPGSRAGVKRVSKTRPRPSQMAGSPFRSAVLGIEEAIGDAIGAGFEDAEDLEGARDGWVGEIRELADEQGSSRDNLPEQFQDGPTGELLQEREEALNTWADALEAVTIPDRDDFPAGEGGDEDFATALQEAADEMGQIGSEV